MKAVVVGMPERDAFALSLLMDRMEPGWECNVLPLQDHLPEGNLYVLDVDNWHGRDEAVARLPALLGDKPAVIVTAPVPLRDEAKSRAAQDTAEWEQRGWVVVRRPFSAEAMRNALERAIAHCGRETRVVSQSAPQPLAALPKAPVATTFSTSAFGIAAVSPRPHTAPGLPVMGEGSLGIAAFAACIETSPYPACRAGLRNLLAHLQAGTAVELSLTLVNGLLFHPAQGWAASNTPTSVLRMVCQSRALTRHVRLNPLPPEDDARQRAERRGMAVHPLGEMLYLLARLADCRLPG